MRKTVSVLKEDVGAILTGIDLDLVPNLYGSFERAVATFVQKADIPETMVTQNLMFYSGVIDYTPDDRMFGSGLIDIRPQSLGRRPWDGVQKSPIEQFDRLKGYGRLPSGYAVSFEYHEGDPVMRVMQSMTTPQVSIDGMSDTDGWAASGDASGLAQDNTVYYHQPASLRFNLAANGAQGLMTKTLDNALSLGDYEGVGVAFLALYLPSAAAISSVSLRLGSSSGNYAEVTVTEGFLGSFYSNDWQLVAFDFADATTTGTPDWDAIDYVRVAINYTSTTALPNMRVGDLWIALPSPQQALFYSPAVFRANTTGAEWAVDITDDNDEIIFRPNSYNIFVQEAAREVAKNQGSGANSALLAGIDLVLNGTGNPDNPGLYAQYRGDNPSEEIRMVGSYYYDNMGGGGGYSSDD